MWILQATRGAGCTASNAQQLNKDDVVGVICSARLTLLDNVEVFVATRASWLWRDRAQLCGGFVKLYQLLGDLALLSTVTTRVKFYT